MPTNLKNCPDSQTLTDFLLGKLPASELDDCREHLVECDPCVETIRGLKVDGDTLNDLSREAWLSSTGKGEPKPENQIVDELMQRMEDLSMHPSTNRLSRADITEYRAAEVQRLFESAKIESDLGRLGKYRIIELLGAGSTGVVYQAIDADLERTVALKILRPSLGESARERFLAEAKATAKLNHPNIVSIFEVGIEGPLAFISMNWEAGETLEQLLAKTENLSVDQTRTLGTHLADALSQAHQLGLIHRDIKPANVWIPDGLGVAGCKILDFGLVRVTDEDPQLTCTGMIAGTPCYMSPEQSRGQSLDGRSDLFSLGCMLYQTLLGKLPFCSENALSTLQSIQRDQPTPPIEMDPSIPQDVSDLVMCLLEKSPSRRPPNSESVVFAFSNARKEWPFEVQLSSSANTDVVAEKVSLKPAGGLGKLIATLLVGLAIGAIGLFGFMYGPQITRIVTNQGVIEINSQVDDVEIEITKNGERIQILDLATNQTIQLSAGAYEIRELGEQNSVQIKNNELTLSRGETEIVTIVRLPNSSQPETVNNQPIDPTPNLIAPGDVLGVFVGGVLGEYDGQPPVHLPVEGSGENPSTGYPIVVDEAGMISLPFIKPINVKGNTVSQAKEKISSAYEAGKNPVFNKGMSRVVVSMMRKHYKIEFGANYKVDSGDVLGVFVEGLLGGLDDEPLVHVPNPTTGLPPSLGFPITVDENGNIDIPQLGLVYVREKTVAEIEKAIRDASLSGDEPIMTESAKIFVSLIQNRSPSISRPQPIGKSGGTDSPINRRSDPITEFLILEQPDGEISDESNLLLEGDLEFQRELFRHGKISVVEYRNAVAKIRNRLWALEGNPSNGLRSSLPKYKNQTYEEHLAIAKVERDFGVLIPALEGLMNLEEETDHKEVVETLMEVSRRRNPVISGEKLRLFSSLQREYFASLSSSQAIDLITHEIANGTRHSLDGIARNFYVLRSLKSDADTSAQAIVEAMASRLESGDSSIDLEQALLRILEEMLSTMKIKDVDLTPFEELVSSNFLNTEDDFYNKMPLTVAKVAPRTPGFLEQVKSRWGNFRTEHELQRLQRLLLITSTLDDEYAVECLPILIEFWEKFVGSRLRMGGQIGDFTQELIQFFERFPEHCHGNLESFEAANEKGLSGAGEYSKLIAAIKASIAEEQE